MGDRVVRFGYSKLPLAGAYVVRKISSAVRGEEQKDQPVLTPCSLAQANKRQSRKWLTAEEASSPDLDDGTVCVPSTDTAVKKHGS
ncbi:hypothetical protein PDJAM_G00209790 [Pangasius djambal]|uniref:Uncharacterized protein n=1 Tax=Pangasius djambal TaxID=1691987 RepID=A0ACC5Y9M0_9TELE|nr:hypothetical protein [Pangasius djambal]